MNLKRVNVIIPGLFKSFQFSEISSELIGRRYLIQKLISRSNLGASQSNTDRTNTDRVFSVDYLQQYPLAFYECLANGTSADKVSDVLYAHPVNLDLKSDHIVALPISILPAEMTGLRALIQTFNHHFLEDGLKLEVLTSGRIVCFSSNNEFPTMVPVHSIYGRDIKHFLPLGNNAKFWLRVFNETQMLLHEYCEEKDRVFGNKLLNSFWFWGGSNALTPQPVSAGFVGNTEWLPGYCQHNQLKHYQLSDIHNSDEKEFYVINESLLFASSCGDFESWLSALNQLESAMLEPLYRLLLAGKINEIVLHESSDKAYKLKRLHRMRFYRKNKSLIDICVQEQ